MSLDKIDSDIYSKKEVFEFIFNGFNENLQSLKQLNYEISENIKEFFAKEEKDLEFLIQSKGLEDEFKGYKEWKKNTLELKSRERKSNHIPPFIHASDEFAEILEEEKITSDFNTINSLGFHAKFIREMSLVYLVSKFESFLSDNLRYMFQIQPGTLKPKILDETQDEKMLSYSEIFTCQDMHQLRKLMAEKEAKKIMSKDIDEINRILNEKFQLLDLSKNDDWEQFKDHYYRRHLIVHTNNTVDEKYLRKFNRKKEPNTTTIIFVSKEFLGISLTLFGKYSKLTHDAFIENFTDHK